MDAKINVESKKTQLEQLYFLVFHIIDDLAFVASLTREKLPVLAKS